MPVLTWFLSFLRLPACRRLHAEDLCELVSPGASEAGAPFSSVHFNALFGDAGSPAAAHVAAAGQLRRSGGPLTRADSGGGTPRQGGAPLEGRASSASRHLFGSPAVALQSPLLVAVRDIAGRLHASPPSQQRPA